MGTERTDRPGPDSLKTLQQIKSSQKKKSRTRKWSREGWLNPLLPSGDGKGRLRVHGGEGRALSFRQGVRNWS